MSKLLSQNGKILITSAGALAIESAGGGGTAKLQEKTVSITQNGETTVVPDNGYDGLSKVKVETNVSESGGNTTTTLEIVGVDEADYDVPFLIAYQTANGEILQAGNVDTMTTTKQFTLPNVLIGGMCFISISIEGSGDLNYIPNRSVNTEGITTNLEPSSETVYRVIVIKITGNNAKAVIQLMP